jgi:hypothetical protein
MIDYSFAVKIFEKFDKTLYYFKNGKFTLFIGGCAKKTANLIASILFSFLQRNRLSNCLHQLVIAAIALFKRSKIICHNVASSFLSSAHTPLHLLLYDIERIDRFSLNIDFRYIDLTQEHQI